MSDFLSELCDIVGPAHCLTDPIDMDPYVREWRGRFKGAAQAVCRPADTAQIAAVVKLCVRHGIAIVPQGGNTGLVGGSVPIVDHTAIVLSTARLDAIIDIDAANFTMTVESGCILSVVQQAALAAKRYFPLSLGAEGSCRIGGNIASNAGGILALRYGVMRDLVLGLEVVLPNGEIWTNLRRLRKDNSGYDLKHLFIGSEGTLGIITKAVLKLYPVPHQRETMFAAIASPQSAINLLAALRERIGENILAFELLCEGNLNDCRTYGPQIVEPLHTKAEWYLLIETMNTPRVTIEDYLATHFENGDVLDATLAESEQQRRDLWFIREAIVEAQRLAGGAIKHDISVPVSDIPAFLAEALPLVERLVPGARALPFGHVGDGNLHFNIASPEGSDNAEFLQQWDDVNHAVHALVLRYHGSLAAEHGVGTFKRDELAATKSPVEMALMRSVKMMLDPDNLLNPGVVISFDK